MKDYVPLFILFLLTGFVVGFFSGVLYQKNQEPQLRINAPGINIEQK